MPRLAAQTAARLTARTAANTAALLAALLFAAGCSNERPCTAIGTPVGVGVQVEGALADKAQTAVMEVCWDGACRQARTDLQPSTQAVEQTCPEGDSCSATMAPTGGKHGFANVAGLAKRPVEVRLTLRDAASAPVMERTVTATPKGRFPNGPECGEGGPNIELTIEADGTVRER
ncbi:hypothetical protein [Nonomuraea sp. NPDC050643]|uniref:hypothetical protein n=1 Tax=Nonomuraea sp. NPDC050643 TaxID=3155660 RepID=UPI00340FF046